MPAALAAASDPYSTRSSYETIWGRPLAGLLSGQHSWLDGIHPDDRPRVDAALADAVEAEGLRCVVAPTIMSDLDRARTLAEVVVAAGRGAS